MSTAAKALLHQTIEALSEAEAQALLNKLPTLLPSMQPDKGLAANPVSRHTWDEVFAAKFALPKQPYALDLSEVSGDDVLF